MGVKMIKNRLRILLAERNLKENRVQGRNRKGRVQVKRDGTTGVGPDPS